MMQEMQLPPEVPEEVPRKPQATILKLASAPETRSPRDIELIARLQKEIALLQVELEKSRNEVVRYEALLRNAKQREMEMRAELTARRK
ncbi:MAG TPA: hypothetical protein VFZ34_09765 [Blastocatellia bacterium]|nr:hypothetical protein [Blastocatellia bacterium]